MKVVVAVAAGLVGLSVSAFATPNLQLDIVGGTYMADTQTTVANSDQFVLEALLLPEENLTLSSLYRVSAALYPMQEQSSPAPDFGTFSFAGTSYDVTGDMVYGVPPAALLPDTTEVGGTLAPHGIFPTYFTEFDVIFSSSLQCAEYNVQSDAGDVASHPGSGMYYQSFLVDVGGMQNGYGIHFDLYRVHEDTLTSGGNGKKSTVTYVTSIDSNEKAPFSHDAESGTEHPRKTPVPVPDSGSTVALLGVALAGLGVMRRVLRG